jgi:integrase
MNNKLKAQINSVLETLFQKYDDSFSMSEKSYRAYLSQAMDFTVRLRKLYPKESFSTPEAERETIIRHLAEEESKIRTIAAWRKLRRSLSVMYLVLGLAGFSERINTIKNPIPPEDRPRRTGRNKRLTTVTSEDFEMMCAHLRKKNQHLAESLCVIARALGLRPCEMPEITFSFEDDKIRVAVPPRKNTKKGTADSRFQRGIERELIVDWSEDLEFALLECREASLSPKDVKVAQEQIRRASLALWSKRVARFCLYSLRYTLGSHLKATYANDPRGAIKIAAVLGHKSTSSARSYGNIRSSGGGFSVPEASEDTCARVIDDCKVRRQKFAKKRIAAPSSPTTIGPALAP